MELLKPGSKERMLHNRVESILVAAKTQHRVQQAPAAEMLADSLGHAIEGYFAEVEGAAEGGVEAKANGANEVTLSQGGKKLALTWSGSWCVEGDGHTGSAARKVVGFVTGR